MTQKSKLIIRSTMLLSIAASLVFTGAAMSYVASEFRTDSDLPVGTLVSLSTEGQLELASRESKEYLGVVVAKDNSVVEVATSGTVPMLVSDIDGEIIENSQVSISGLSGVATLSAGDGGIVGVVVVAPTSWSPRFVQGSDADNVNVGSATVRMIESKMVNRAEGNSYLNFLQNAASGVAGKEVDTWRAVVALLIGLGGVALAFVLLATSSRSSFLSLGRNPMAGTSIMRGLWKVSAIAVLILLVSLTTSYLIVRMA